MSIASTGLNDLSTALEQPVAHGVRPKGQGFSAILSALAPDTQAAVGVPTATVGMPTVAEGAGAPRSGGEPSGSEAVGADDAVLPPGVEENMDLPVTPQPSAATRTAGDEKVQTAAGSQDAVSPYATIAGQVAPVGKGVRQHGKADLPAPAAAGAELAEIPAEKEAEPEKDQAAKDQAAKDQVSDGHVVEGPLGQAAAVQPSPPVVVGAAITPAPVGGDADAPQNDPPHISVAAAAVPASRPGAAMVDPSAREASDDSPAAAGIAPPVQADSSAAPKAGVNPAKSRLPAHIGTMADQVSAQPLDRDAAIASAVATAGSGEGKMPHAASQVEDAQAASQPMSQPSTVQPFAPPPLQAGTHAPAPLPSPTTAQAAAVPQHQQVLEDLLVGHSVEDQWVDRLSQDVQALIGSDNREARLHLRPRELGDLSIRLEMHEGRAKVHFNVENQAAQALITDAAPRLQAMLSDRGVKLEQASVDVGGSGAGAGRNGAGDGSGGNGRPGPQDFGAKAPPSAMAAIAKRVARLTAFERYA